MLCIHRLTVHTVNMWWGFWSPGAWQGQVSTQMHCSDSLSLCSSSESPAHAGDTCLRLCLPAHQAPERRPSGTAGAEAGQDGRQWGSRHRPERGRAAGCHAGEGRPELAAGRAFLTLTSTLWCQKETLPLTDARSVFPRWVEGPAVGLHLSTGNTNPGGLKTP